MKRKTILIILILLSLFLLAFGAAGWTCLSGATCHVLMSANTKTGNSTEYILCYNENGPGEIGFESLGDGVAVVECQGE